MEDSNLPIVINPKFGSFVRAMIGLPYVPLDRLDEGVRNLECLGNGVIGQTGSLQTRWFDT